MTYTENNNIKDIKICRRNLQNVVKYLSNSGLWHPMLKGANYLLSLSDDVLLSMRTWDGYHKVMTSDLEEKGIAWFGMDCFDSLFIKRIKTANFHSNNKDYIKQKIEESIKNKAPYFYSWRKQYDNSIEVRFGDDYIRGWYSEEYKNCGNGHYYFLLDECHVLYSEDD